MCGICGTINFNGQSVTKDVLKKMNDRMLHRGPDDEGYFIDDNVGLAMRRLSIIDLKGGHQPISNEDDSVIVVLNGEIYNYVELREELLKKGHTFKTGSDTEVVVHLFEEEGINLVHKLNGMFGIALFNKNERKLYIIRDRLGIKPLFYHVTGYSFSFSSDLLSLNALTNIKQIDETSFLLYLGLNYVPYPRSILANINKLEPGFYLEIDEDGIVQKNQYWDLDILTTEKKDSVEQYVSLFKQEFAKSVNFQKRSDVPIGTFLSGGFDSSAVVAFLTENIGKSVKTYSLGFTAGFNELPFAKEVAQKYNSVHYESTVDVDQVKEAVETLIDYLDEPLADNSIVPSFILSKEARENGVKVILNGTGGDEIFGGYTRYIKKWYHRILNFVPDIIKKVTGFLVSLVNYDVGLHIMYNELMFFNHISGVNFGFLRKAVKNSKDVRQIQEKLQDHFWKFNGDMKDTATLLYFDLKSYLVDDVLALTDKMTMANSIEGRVPFLDHTFIEAMFKIPIEVRMKHNKTKWLLKESLKDTVPASLYTLPKTGFAGPSLYWVKDVLFDDIYKHLIDEPIPLIKDKFDSCFLKTILDKRAIDSTNSVFIFSMYILTKWYKKNLQGT